MTAAAARRAVAPALVLLLSVACGIAIAWVDSRPGWDDSGMPCATAALCSGGMCTAPTCDVGEKRCNVAQPQVCNADRTGYDPVDSCATPAHCSAIEKK